MRGEGHKVFLLYHTYFVLKSTAYNKMQKRISEAPESTDETTKTNEENDEKQL